MKLNQLRWIAMCILAQCSVPLFSMESISLTEPEKLGSPEEFARDITDKMLELYPHIDEIMSLGPDFDIASVFEAQEKLRKDIDQDLDSLFKEAEKKDTENRNRLKIPETAPFRQYLMITAGKILKENIESRTLIAAMTRLNSDVFSWLDAATGILLYVLGGQDQIAAITKVEKKLTLKKFIDQRRNLK